MLNYEIPGIPERPSKPRESGITMVMDKGLPLRQAEDLVQAAGELIDFVKFGFGTSAVSKGVLEKISLYQKAGIRPFFGGTLFEAFVVRNRFDDYRRLLDSFNLETVEVSDGSYAMEMDEKSRYISLLSKDFYVLSEVGSKDAEVHFEPKTWADNMKAELAAGATKVIAEARESGTVGIYDKKGNADSGLIEYISEEVPPMQVLWEAPDKKQQVWFIKKLGPNVNLGNISTNEVISLETLRLGLRGDTFFDFLPKKD